MAGCQSRTIDQSKLKETLVNRRSNCSWNIVECGLAIGLLAVWDCDSSDLLNNGRVGQAVGCVVSSDISVPADLKMLR